MIRNLTVDGRRIALRVNDSGWEKGRKTLFFIHGSGFDQHLWDGQYGPLGKEFNVAGIDLPGHGASDGTGEETVGAYVEWVRKALDMAGLKRPVLVGHSLGAAVSLSFALRYGEEIQAIVPMGGGATMPVNSQILEGIITDRQATIGFIAKFSFARENRSRFGGEMTEVLMKVDPALIRGDFLACNRLDLTADLERIAVPALFVCGEEDKMTPPEFSRFAAGKLPGAELRLIPGAGHFVMWETAGTLNEVLGDFTRRLPER